VPVTITIDLTESDIDPDEFIETARKHGLALIDDDPSPVPEVTAFEDPPPPEDDASIDVF
jgi:hypothetical protein